MTDALPQPQPNTEDVRYEIEPEGLVVAPPTGEDVRRALADDDGWIQSDCGRFEHKRLGGGVIGRASQKRVWNRLVQSMNDGESER